MRTIFRLFRWFGKVLDRDGLGWAGFWASVAAAFLFGAFLDCAQTKFRVNAAKMDVEYMRRALVDRGHMEVWRTPDGETVYRWTEE